MHTTTPFRTERALVLHGGGAAGNAWEIGVLAGLLDAGLDVTGADLIVGTSAGATAAAQITSARLPELLAAALTPAPGSLVAPGGRGAPGVDHLARSQGVIDASTSADDMHRRMGAAALELDVDDAWSTRWHAITAARLPDLDWPEQRILITAVDARTGEGVAFDRDSGVPFLDAIAASTSSGAPYRIGDDRYIDGGYRRNENADLATGYQRVLVLSPFSGRTRHPLEWGMQLAAQVDELRAGGSAVEAVFPDADSLAAFGSSMIDPATRPASARAGFAQGETLGKRLTRLWH